MESQDRIYYAVTAKETPILRAIHDEARKTIHKLSIRLGVTIDYITDNEQFSPEEAERQVLRMWTDEQKDFERWYIEEQDDAWVIKDKDNPDYVLSFIRPRTVEHYLADNVRGYEYERLVICRLTGLLPDDVDRMTLGQFEQCRRILHSACPSITAKGRF